MLTDWVQTFGLRIRGGVRLVLAETKLAVTTFVLMIFLAVLSAGLVVLGWAFLLFAAVQALSLAGLKLVSAIVVVSAAQLVMAWLLWRLASRLGRHMEFRATRGLMETGS